MTTELWLLLKTAESALRSYQFGNSSPDLAEEVANEIKRVLEAQPPATSTANLTG